MVLQQAPNQANVWGYTSDCEDKVSVNFNNVDHPATIIKGASEIANQFILYTMQKLLLLLAVNCM